MALKRSAKYGIFFVSGKPFSKKNTPVWIFVVVVVISVCIVYVSPLKEPIIILYG